MTLSPKKYQPAKGTACEVLLPPTGNYLQVNVVNVPSGIDYLGNPYDFVTNYLNLIVTQSATNSTFLDDSIVAATNFVPIGMTGYYGAQISVTSGTHIITFTMSDGYRDSTNAATVTLTTGDPNLSANYQTAMTGTNQSGQYIFQFRNGVPLQTP